VYVGHCVNVMTQLPERSYRLVFADPPFNIGYDYNGEYDDRMTPAQYERFSLNWIAEACRLVAHNGSLVVAIGDDYAAQIKLMLDDYGFTMRNWIVWHYTFGVHCTTKFGRDHTHLLYYVRDDDNFIFNEHAIRIESERQRIGDKRAVPEGRVPGDVWTFPRLVGNAKERTGHPCQMPLVVLDRLILALTNPRDAVLDPFAGSGTTLVSALRLGRMADGIEQSQNYVTNYVIPRISGTF
jgi:site-specific DNA-methyltransferase (adenine-specific)